MELIIMYRILINNASSYTNAISINIEFHYNLKLDSMIKCKEIIKFEIRN
jgi:hypothetical protein